MRMLMFVNVSSGFGDAARPGTENHDQEGFRSARLKPVPAKRCLARIAPLVTGRLARVTDRPLLHSRRRLGILLSWRWTTAVNIRQPM